MSFPLKVNIFNKHLFQLFRFIFIGLYICSIFFQLQKVNNIYGLWLHKTIYKGIV